MLILGGVIVWKIYQKSYVTIHNSNSAAVLQTAERLSQSFIIVDNTIIGLTAGEVVSSWYKQTPIDFNRESFVVYKENLFKEIHHFLTYNSALQYGLLAYVSVFINNELISSIYTRAYTLRGLTRDSRDVFEQFIQSSADYTSLIPPTQNRPFIFKSRKIKNDFTKDEALVILVGTTEADIAQKYNGLIDENENKVFIVDENNTIYSTQDKSLLGKQFQLKFNSSGSSNQNEVSYCSFEENSYVYYQEPIESTNFSIIFLVPEANLFKENSIEIRGYIVLILFLTLLMVFVGVLLSAKNTSFVKTLIEDSYESEIMLKEMQIKSLQQQMNPHFLFNILLTLQIRAKKCSDEILYKMITSLSHLLRNGIYEENVAFITIDQELKNIEFYLYLQNQRFGDKLEYNIHIEPNLGKCLIPKLCIEPLIENTFNHGFKNFEQEGHIELSVTSRDEVLYIQIIDNGAGFDATKILEQSDSHEKIGIKNTDRRIKLIYGECYGIQIVSHKGKGTKATVTIPITSNEERGADAECRSRR
ncbi:MAG: histidine kinase [Spirochaetales bacterium]|nr:histidine kinase [Spirochaetales bacterium]